jgi:hypothetical protein
MYKQYGRILSVLFGLTAFAFTAKGQVVDQLAVKIPYPFVVAGKTLPAGSYTVSRANNQDVGALVISSFENHASVVVLSMEIADRTKVDQIGLSFEQIGDQYFLSKVETTQHVFTIPVSNPGGQEIAMKRNSGMHRSERSGE